MAGVLGFETLYADADSKPGAHCNRLATIPQTGNSLIGNEDACP